LNLLRCAHPEPALGVTGLAGVLALASGRGAGTFWVVTAVLAGQLFVGWTNDYLDRERDTKAERTDKPLPAGQVRPTTVRNAALIALVAAVPLSLASGVAAGAAHLSAVGAATAYNLGLKTTPLSLLPYLFAFAMFPAFITLGLPSHRLPPAWAVLAGSLLGGGAHFSQVLPDIEDDRRQNLLGLPQRLGARTSAIVAALLLAAAAVAIAFGPSAHPLSLTIAALVASLLIVAAVLVAALVEQKKLAFRLTIVAAAAVVLSFLLSGRSLA
jgi:4-hydroxybenzoate polyprenyltransferase